MCVMARTLIKALENGEETLAKDIIQCGSYALKDSATTNTIDTALFFCCSRGFLELVKLLLDKAANVACTGKNQATPLHAAVDNGHLNVVRLLLEHGADVNAKNYRDDTPLHLAAYRGYSQIVQCLLESGADCQAVNGGSFTAETEAFVNGHHQLGYYLRLQRSACHTSQTMEGHKQFHPMITLDTPPASFNPGTSSHEQKHSVKPHGSHNTYFKKEHSSGSIPPFFGDRTKENIATHEISENISNCVFPKILESPSKSINGDHSLNSSWQIDSLLTNKHSFAPVQPKAGTTCGNYCYSNHRRRSTSSNSSCFSDVSMCTGSSGSQSLLSTGSDSSLSCSDYKRDYLDLQERTEKNFPDTHNEDILFLSLGVRNPPTNKFRKSLSINFQPTGPPDIPRVFDSTIISVRPTQNKSTFLLATSSSNISDCFLRSDDFDKNHIDKTHSLPVNSLCPVSSNTPKQVPQYEPFKSVNLRSMDLQRRNSGNELFPSLKRMPSNDLSSLTQPCPISMTSVNIPLSLEKQ